LYCSTLAKDCSEDGPDLEYLEAIRIQAADLRRRSDAAEEDYHWLEVEFIDAVVSIHL